MRFNALLPAALTSRLTTRGTATTLPMSPIFHGISALSRKSPRSDFVVSESINKMAGFTSAEGPRGVQLSILHPWTGLPPLRPRIIYIIFMQRNRAKSDPLSDACFTAGARDDAGIFFGNLAHPFEIQRM